MPDAAAASFCLRLDAKSWPGLRRHSGLKAIQAGRASRQQAEIVLVDTPARALAELGWLCLSENDQPHLLALAQGKVLPNPDIEALGNLAILARGKLERLVLPLSGSRRLLLEKYELAVKRKPASLAVLRCDGFTAAEAAAWLLELAGDPAAPGLKFGLLGSEPGVALAAMLGLAAPKPVKAPELPSQIPAGDSAIAAACAILRHCLLQFDANIQPVLLGQDSEGVHQMRVALRRLRSALDIFAAILPAGWLAAMLDDLRWLNTPLGQRRDLDVFVEETLAPLRAAQPDLAGLGQLNKLLDTRRLAAQADLVVALQSPRATAALLRLRWLAALDEAEILRQLEPAQHEAALLPAISFAALSLKKRRRKLKQLGERHAELTVPELHRLRIRAKKLRYASDFFRYLFAKKPSKLAGITLARLQDTLGALNDAAVGDQLLKGLLGPVDQDPAAAAIAGWFAARQAAQLAQLGPAWQEYARLKPFWKAALPEAA